MRMFWASVFTLLIAASGFVVWNATNSTPESTGTPIEVMAPSVNVAPDDAAEIVVASARPASAHPTPAEKAPEPVAAPAIEPVSQPASVERAEADRALTDSGPWAWSPPATDASQEVAQEPAQETTAAPAPEQSQQEQTQDATTDAVATDTTNEPTVETTAEPAVSAPAASETAHANTVADAAPAAAPADSGALVINGATIPGNGTAEQPYIIDWKLLTSVSQTYKPRDGLTTLPEWANTLNGARVRLTGFLLLPVAMGRTSEMLLMMNQWDGCCIGVPPTPYDAVEVRLGQPLDTSNTFINHGVIEGTLKVDPYIVRNYLLGLYLLEDAKLSDKSVAGQPIPHMGAQSP